MLGSFRYTHKFLHRLFHSNKHDALYRIKFLKSFGTKRTQSQQFTYVVPTFDRTDISKSKIKTCHQLDPSMLSINIGASPSPSLDRRTYIAGFSATRKLSFSRNKSSVANNDVGDFAYRTPEKDCAHQKPAGSLSDTNEPSSFISQIPLPSNDGCRSKRVLVLCTGGTLTMAPNSLRGGALEPVQGAISDYMIHMDEIHDNPSMPEVVIHEYKPFLDSSDVGSSDWALLAHDIKANYLHFDGFVVLMGTDTMAYCATALSFMLENLGKPVIFTGSQIPLCEPYNDARRNLIMSLIFAARDSIPEVCIFFHDRLLRACRSTKVDTHSLMAFDSPNMNPLATIGVNITENRNLALPHARGVLRVHSRMDTRLITMRLVPGFDDGMMRAMIDAATKTNLRALVLQLYGTGNVPTIKGEFIKVLADAKSKGVLVVASTQCHSGTVVMGRYATGKALQDAGVISGSDMTIEAISCKLAYLLGRKDLSATEVANLMNVSLRGEVTPEDAFEPPTLPSAYEKAMKKGKNHY